MKLLLVQSGFLGDVVLSTPLIGALTSIYPRADISVLTTPAAADLLRFDSRIRQVIVYDKRKSQRGLLGLFRMARLLKEEKFDAAFSLHKSFRTAALLALARIPQRFGFREASAWWLYTKTARRKDLPHEALRNLALLRTVGHNVDEFEQDLIIALSAEALAQAREGLGESSPMPLIGIAPGSVWATKRWTAEGFAECARLLVQQGCRIALIGGPSDTAIAQEVERLAGVSLLNFVGKTDLQVSAALISLLDCLITNDSAPLHLASAFKVPTVAVFCATVPEFGYGPWRTAAETVGVSGLSCRPCRRHGGQTCPTGTHACRREIRPETVSSSALRLLEQAQRNKVSAANPG